MLPINKQDAPSNALKKVYPRMVYSSPVLGHKVDQRPNGAHAAALTNATSPPPKRNNCSPNERRLAQASRPMKGTSIEVH